MAILQDLDLMKVRIQKKEKNYGLFNIEPLAPGYGVTIANSLRRVILASIPGAAITTVKINNNTHEFSTIPGVKEDLVEIILNLKSLRIKKLTDEDITIKLKAKGNKVVTAKDFEKHPDIEIIDPDHHIATLDKNGKLDIQAIVKTGTGYLPVENRQNEKLPLGFISIDAIFTPIKKINYTVENTRVGQKTDYDKIVFEITTDGSLDPEETFYLGAQILSEHFTEITNQLSPSQISTSKPKNSQKNTRKSTKNKVSRGKTKTKK